MLPLENPHRPLIGPSLLAARFDRLAEDLALVEGEMDFLHLDIMDGHFVPNISYGPAVVEALRPLSTAPFDVHLMVERPEAWVSPFLKAGAELMVFHIESTRHGHRLCQNIREAGVQVGVALCPQSPVSMVEHLLDEIDLLLIMTVNPGFGGQAYIQSMEDKMKAAKALIQDRPIRLQVDGGINQRSIQGAARAGANTFVAGSAVFKAEDPKEEIRLLRRLAEEA